MAWNDQKPDFGLGYKPSIQFNRETGWAPASDYGREIGSESWQNAQRVFNPEEFSRFNTYKAGQESKYNSPYAQSERMASNTSNMLAGLLTDPSQIQQSAGYQFARDQGEQAINRSAAAKGMLGSGNVLAELAKYGQGMASQEYGNQVNRLSGLLGQSQQYLLNANAGPYQRAALNPYTGGMTDGPATAYSTTNW